MPVTREELQEMIIAWNEQEGLVNLEDTFVEVQQELDKLERLVNQTKGEEYSKTNDTTRNFKEAGEFLSHADAIDACGVYMFKHWCGIRSWIRNRKALSDEALKGRVLDLRLYLALFYTLAVELGEVD